MNSKELLTQITALIENYTQSVDNKIENIVSPALTVENIEQYLSKSGQSFVELGTKLGYIVTTPVVSDEEAKDVVSDEDKSDIVYKTEDELLSFTKQEILEEIQKIDSKYDVSLSNVTKDELITEYKSKIA
jgi:hypothetical protein